MAALSLMMTHTHTLATRSANQWHCWYCQSMRTDTWQSGRVMANSFFICHVTWYWHMISESYTLHQQTSSMRFSSKVRQKCMQEHVVHCCNMLKIIRPFCQAFLLGIKHGFTATTFRQTTRHTKRCPHHQRWFLWLQGSGASISSSLWPEHESKYLRKVSAIHSTCSPLKAASNDLPATRICTMKMNHDTWL